jgi:molybdenum cofactor cytidylyltransferase
MVPGIVLAGGKSSRMGTPKALLPVGTSAETFLDRITGTLLDGGVDEVLVVVGADADVIRARAHLRPRVQIVDNPDYERGQLTSLLAALRQIDESVASGVLVTLVDVPLVSVETVRALLAAHRDSTAAIVRPVSNGRHGHPVIFHRRLFDQLHRADPAVGAKPVLRAYAADMIEIPVDDEGAFIDIDTREDYERWIGPLT